MQRNLIKPITKAVKWSRMTHSIRLADYAKVYFCRVAMAAGNGLREVA